MFGFGAGNSINTQGYDFELENESTPQSYKCTICFCLMRDAVETPCGHAGCKRCIEQWGRTGLSRNCPTCRKPFAVNGLNPVRSLDRIIRNDIRVKCKQIPQCNWVGSIDQYDDSHKKNCEFIEVNCLNFGTGCTIRKIRKEIKEHEKECQYRMVCCQFCKVIEMPLIQMSAHVITCTIKCPNEPCPKWLTKTLYKDHMRTCDFAVIPCNFHFYGCQDIVKRVDMDKHLNENLQQHFDFVIVKLNTTQQDFFETQSDLDKLKLEVKNTKSELEKTKSELKNTKTEMKKMQTTLEQTKSELKDSKSELQSTKSELENLRQTSENEVIKVSSKETDFSSKNVNTHTNTRKRSSTSTPMYASSSKRLVRLPSAVKRVSAVSAHAQECEPQIIKDEDEEKRESEKDLKRFHHLATLMDNNLNRFFRELTKEDSLLLSHDGETLLHRAVNGIQSPVYACVRKLVELGCPVNARNGSGRTCLQEAVTRDLKFKDGYRMIDSLLKYGEFKESAIMEIKSTLHHDKKLRAKFDAYLKKLKK